MKPLRFFQLTSCLLALAAGGGMSLRSAEPGRQSLLFAGTIKDYVYPATEFVLKGDEAKRLPNGTLKLEGITVETRRVEGAINLILKTPECIFDPTPDSRLVTSTSMLEVVDQGGRFMLTGQGYQFRPVTNQLSIFSNVVTRFDRSFFTGTNAPATLGKTTNGYFSVTSQQAEFNGVTGETAWRRDVLATDGDNLSVRAGEVLFNIASLTNKVRKFVAREDVEMEMRADGETALARGAEAVFSAEEGLDARVLLTGEPSWERGLLSGRAGRLVWESITNQFKLVGDGGAQVRFPQTVLSTNTSATNLVWMDIGAGHHEFVPGLLSFGGGVLAKQGTNWAFTSRELMATLDATNRPTSIVADREFHFQVHQPGSEGEGWSDRAAFGVATDGRQNVVLTGSPRWVSTDLETSADTLTVTDPLGVQEIAAVGNSRVQIAAVNLSGFNWFGGPTNSPAHRPAPTNSAPFIITASQYRFAGNEVVFAGNVRGSQGTNTFVAETLTLLLTPERQLRELHATGGVIVRQGAMVLAAQTLTAWFDEAGVVARAEARDQVRLCALQPSGSGRATGAQLDYEAGSGLAVLTGQPELIFWPSPRQRKEGQTDPPRTALPVRHTGKIVHWNVRTEGLGGEGEYRQMNLPANVEIPRTCE